MTNRRAKRSASAYYQPPETAPDTVVIQTTNWPFEPRLTTLFEDVGAFHAKFDLPHAADGHGPPSPLDPDTLQYRLHFMMEELAEYARSQGAIGLADQLDGLIRQLGELPMVESGVAGLADGADALVDLVYVALGTAHLMRLPFDACWAEVQRANLAKERATGADDPRSKRQHRLDVVKPAGWRGPDHWPLIYAAAVRR